MANKLEKKALHQINVLNEGLFSSFGEKLLNRSFLKAAKLAQKDPALKAAFDSYDQAAADFESTVEDVAQSLDDIEAGKGKIKMSDKEWKKQNFKQRMKIIKSLGY